MPKSFPGDVENSAKQNNINQTSDHFMLGGKSSEKKECQKMVNLRSEQYVFGTPGYTRSCRSAFEGQSTEIIRKLTKFQKNSAKQTMLAKVFAKFFGAKYFSSSRSYV